MEAEAVRCFQCLERRTDGGMYRQSWRYESSKSCPHSPRQQRKSADGNFSRQQVKSISRSNTCCNSMLVRFAWSGFLAVELHHILNLMRRKSSTCCYPTDSTFSG